MDDFEDEFEVLFREFEVQTQTELLKLQKRLHNIKLDFISKINKLKEGDDVDDG